MAEPVFGKKIMVDYKAQRWKYEQHVIAKTEVGAKGSKIRFVVTKNKNNSPEPHLLYMPEHGMRLCMPIGQFRCNSGLEDTHERLLGGMLMTA